MNYQQTLEYLYSSLPMYQRSGGAAYKANLDNTIALDNLTGNSHRMFRSIHIAGTNGKGSVSHMLASVLKEAGFRTGLYTSPHLLDFRERIRIDGQMIDKDYIVAFVETIRRELESMEPSFFELTVALAFCYFRDMQVDIAVVETGMGGRLDSTNIITPELSVITNISLDHTQFLGHDISSIAREKAGIIKHKVPVVIGHASQEVMEVFRTVAGERSAPIFLADNRLSFGYQTLLANGISAFHYTDRNGNAETWMSDLSGEYQSENILTTITSLEILSEHGLRLPGDCIDKGLRNTVRSTGLRGRWETLGANPRIICDTAHNGAGVASVMNQLTKIPARKRYIIWGMVNDKPLDEIIALLPKDAIYFFTRASIPRAMDPAVLAGAARKAGLEFDITGSVEEAVGKVLELAGPDDLVFVGGSTFIVADALSIHPLIR